MSTLVVGAYCREYQGAHYRNLSKNGLVTRGWARFRFHGSNPAPEQRLWPWPQSPREGRQPWEPTTPATKE